MPQIGQTEENPCSPLPFFVVNPLSRDRACVYSGKRVSFSASCAIAQINIRRRAGGRTDGRTTQNERKEMGMGDKRTDNAAKANGQFLPYQLAAGDGWRDTTPRFERSLILERKVSL